MRPSLRLSIATLLLGAVVVVGLTGLGSDSRAALSHARVGAAALQGRAGGAVVLVIHGGAWYRVGPASVRHMAPDAARLRRWGYRTSLVDYRALGHAFPDVLAAYDHVRRLVGKRTPICAYGASAGGHMALMLAIRRPDVACVVAQAPPTLLAGLPLGLRRLAAVSFDAAGGLDDWSPAEYRLRTPALIEQALTDDVVPLRDSSAMHVADPNSELRLLPHGPRPWTHADVAPGPLRALYGTEREFMRHAVARWIAHGPEPRARFLGR